MRGHRVKGSRHIFGMRHIFEMMSFFNREDVTKSKAPMRFGCLCNSEAQAIGLGVRRLTNYDFSLLFLSGVPLADVAAALRKLSLFWNMYLDR
jgi:hypothetical protein